MLKLPKKFVLIVVVILAVAGVIGLNSFLVSATSKSKSGELLSDNYYVYDTKYFEKNQSRPSATLLNFYASWCSTCNQMEPIIVDVFSEMGLRENVYGYRVNFGDSGETRGGKALADKYKITTQSALVVLNSDGQVFKTFFTPVTAEVLKLTLVSATLV